MKAENKAVRQVEILLVEDNPGDAALMGQTLEQSTKSIHLKVAHDGESALHYLRQVVLPSRLPFPDFIFLDLDLPGKSGWEVLAEIKEDSRLRKIPVLILTGSEKDEDARKGCFSLADDYILKPKDLSHFGTLLNYLEENWLTHVPSPGKS